MFARVLTTNRPLRTVWPGAVPGLIYAVIACHFALNFARTAGYFLDISNYIAGKEMPPFQYRALMRPVFGWLMTALNGADLRASLTHAPWFLAKPEEQAYAIVNMAGIFFALVGFHGISRTVFASRLRVFWSMFLFVTLTYGLFVLNPNLNFTMPYDLPALAFTQCCVLLVLHKRWLWLVPLFALATANRETSLLIVVFLASHVLYGTTARVVTIRWTIVMTMVWLAVKAWMNWLATGWNGPINHVRITLGDNAAELLKPWQWPSLLLVLCVVPLCVVVLRERRAESFSWALTCLAGFAVLIMMALITEHRAFGDLIGFAVIALVFCLERYGLLPTGESAAGVPA